MTIYTQQRFVFMTLDPVHIGTGGTRLGRVDNSIVREPGTRLPKIPGTSLSGAARSYAAYRYGKRRCAGQGQSGEGHCGRPTCPICYTFGSVNGERSFSGVVSIGDALLLLFPVYSMAGPVWVTSPATLKDIGVENQSVNGGKAKWASGITEQKHLNLSWLMVEKEGELSLDNLPENIPDHIRERMVLVSDKLFSQVVNSNLEVRTSVAINPETGAAEDKALFTYESIPRAAILWMDVVVDDFREAFPYKERLEEWKEALEEQGNAAKDLLRKWRLWKGSDGNSKFGESVQKALAWVQDDLNRYTNGATWQNPASVVSAGLELAEPLGIGGMGTRGFGRIRTREVQQ